MKTNPHLRAGLIVCLLAGTAVAQTAAPTPASDDETITLSEFTVTSDRVSGYRATTAVTATGIGTKIGDTPLAISVVTNELIQDTSGFEMREALNLVPGVLTNPRSESSVVIRGFGGLISYRNGMYRRQLMTTWNIDRVEVIKGPAAIFFGAVRPGGIVNNVTIKPVFTGDFTDLKVQVGTEGFVRGEAFQNLKLGDKLAVRVGVGGSRTDGSRPYEYLNETYLGLSAIWKPTENQQLTLDLEEINRRAFYLSSYPVRALANSKIYGQPGAIAAQAGINRQSTNADSANRAYLQSLGYSTTVGAANFYPLYDMFAPYGDDTTLTRDAKQWMEGRAVDLDYLLKLGNGLVWQTSLNYAFDDTAGIQPSDGDTRPYADGTVRFRSENFINIRDSYNVHNKLTWRFNVLSMKHTVQLAQEYQRVIFTRPGYQDANNRYNDSPGNNGSSSTNPYVTGYLPGVSDPVSIWSVFNGSGQTFNITRKRWENNAGYYLVDQAQLFHDRVFVLGGIRYNKFTGKITYDKPVSNSSLSKSAPNGLIDRDVIGAKGDWTPQAGVLVKLTPQLSAFTTYSESIEPNFQLDADGVASEPVSSSSWDIGLKAELMDGRLTSTVSYYDISRDNIAYRDTTREVATGRSPYYVFGNSEASKGVELDANWSPTNSYTLIAGWSHVTEAETTKSNNPTFVGRRFGGIPENTYVLWNRFTVPSGAAKGLTFGLGVRHNDGTNLSQDPQNVVRLPAFTVFDAMMSYSFRAFHRDLKAQLNVKNVTDKLYREGSDGFFAPRRMIYLSVSTRL